MSMRLVERRAPHNRLGAHYLRTDRTCPRGVLLDPGGRAKVVNQVVEVKTTTSTGWPRPRIATFSMRPPGNSCSMSG